MARSPVSRTAATRNAPHPDSTAVASEGAATGSGRQPKGATSAAPLSVRERLVHQELAKLSPTTASAYLHALDLVSFVDHDPAAVALVGHIVRELLNALPRIQADVPIPARVKYADAVGRIADLWPADDGGRRGPLPEEARQQLDVLVTDHVASRSRREEALDLVARFDPAHARSVPASAGRHWGRLRERAVDLAHALVRDPAEPPPDPAEARALLEEFTATLHAIFAPFYEAMDVIDALLAHPQVGRDEVVMAEAILKTPAQFARFFERADARWLDPLARAGFFDAPPGLEDAGEGYVRTPRWPEGEYLARVAPDAPAAVIRLAARVPLGDNPRVGAALIAIAGAHPVGLGGQLVPRIAAWLSVPLGLRLLSRDAIALDRQLIGAGQLGPAQRLFTALLDAATGPQGEDWELEQVLGLPDAFPEAALPRVTGVLQESLRQQLDPESATDRYSSVWLRRVDRVPRLGRDRPGRLVEALYRSLVRTPARNADGAVGRFLQDDRRVLHRVALAVAADHAEPVGPIDELIGAPEHWDRPDTRYEFRRLVRNRFSIASEVARERLLMYAERADEVSEILASMPDAGKGVDVEQLKRRWRTRLLGAVWEHVPAVWQVRLGPPVEGEPLIDERPEPEAHFVSDSPFVPEDLAGKSSQELAALVLAWQPDPANPWHSRHGVAASVVSAVMADFARFADELPALVEAGPEVTTRLARQLGQRVPEDASLTCVSLLPFLERAAQQLRQSDPVAAGVRSDLARNLAWMIERLAEAQRVQGSADDVQRIGVLALQLFDEREAEEGLDAGPPSVGWGALERMLNTVAGSVIRAAAALAAAAVAAGHPRAARPILERLDDVADNCTSSVTAAALGAAFPWIARADLPAAERRASVLFGPVAPASIRRAAFETYLVSWRYTSRMGALLADAYDTALAEVETGSEPPWDVALGQHLAIADLTDLLGAREQGWVERWYAQAGDEQRAAVTRVLAEIAVGEAGPVCRRARNLLRWRVASPDVAPGDRELEEVSWASEADHGREEVLAEIVLPALERTGGRATDAPGVATLIARQARVQPDAAVRALRLLVDGDEYLAVASLARDQLREGLSALLDATPDVAVRARQLIHDLGARGALEFRDLLDGSPPSTG
jgi:hypothetical protein